MTQRSRWPGTAAVAVALTTLLAGCSGPRALYWPIIPPDIPAPRVVGAAADGTTVEIVRTQWLLVQLPVEPESAKRWAVTIDRDRALYPSGDSPRFESPSGSAAGGANAIYTFRAEGTGITSLRFVYRDPAAPQSPPLRTVAFDVVAR